MTRDFLTRSLLRPENKGKWVWERDEDDEQADREYDYRRTAPVKAKQGDIWAARAIRPTKVERPDTGLRGYFAGLFDGEGSVICHVGRTSSKGAHGSKDRRRRFNAIGVSLELLHPAEPLLLLQAYYGGAVAWHPPRRGGHENSWMGHWSISGRAAALFFEEVGSYLVIKRSQVEIALRIIHISGYTDVRRKQAAINEFAQAKGRAPLDFDGDTLWLREHQEEAT